MEPQKTPIGQTVINKIVRKHLHQISEQVPSIRTGEQLRNAIDDIVQHGSLVPSLTRGGNPVLALKSAYGNLVVVLKPFGPGGHQWRILSVFPDGRI